MRASLIPSGIAALVCLLAAAAPAQAQSRSFCSGAIMAEQFSTHPDPSSAATGHRVILRNASAQTRTFQVFVDGALRDRPSGQQYELAPSVTVRIEMGYTLPGNPPMRMPLLGEVLRVVCL